LIQQRFNALQRQAIESQNQAKCLIQISNLELIILEITIGILAESEPLNYHQTFIESLGNTI
jgi:hypothetical protein